MSFLAYARLLRLPNVFTAMADIGLGALATDAVPEHIPRFLLVLGCSSVLYSAGMVWNDFFDVEQDRRERPFRPLPSGNVSTTTALVLGVLLLVIGLACAVVADLASEGTTWQSSALAGCLVAAILLYDGWLKRTWAGPLAMGACRFLNVLLGLSVAGQALAPLGLMLALVVGLYIVGVTWFARTEAALSQQSALRGAAGVMLGAILLALTLPVLSEQDRPPSILFPYLLVAFGLYLGAALLPAIARPMPTLVQAAVKRAVLGLILLDAVLATALAGNVGLVLVLLLIPARMLGRWVYST